MPHTCGSFDDIKTKETKMKKLKIFTAVAAAVLLLAGCSKKDTAETRKPSENIDSSKWIDNLIDGKAAAERENKKVFLFFSGDDQDQSSARLKENVFNTSDFMEKMTESYVLVNLDFSNSLFDAASADPLASEEEKAEAAKIWVTLEENMRDAGLYNIQATPSFYLLTKEGYVIAEMIFDQEPKNADDFFSAYGAMEEQIAEYENILASAQKGKKDDRLVAINKLFDRTEPQLRYLLTDLSADYIKLDKKNSTGMVGAHIVAIANAHAVQAYLDQDPLAASEEFAKAAQSKYLDSDQKQQCYYTAGYLLAQSGTTDYAKVKEYLQEAYDAAPESSYASTIQSMIRMMEENYGEGLFSGDGQEEDDSNDSSSQSEDEASASDGSVENGQ